MERITRLLGFGLSVALLALHSIKNSPHQLVRAVFYVYCRTFYGSREGIMNTMKKIVTSLMTLAVFVPYFALAQFGPIDTFLGKISVFINTVLVPLIFAVALLFFIYGMFKYFIQGGDSDDSREKGKQLMVYSVIGFVLMVSIWGIVNLIAGGLSTGLGTSNDLNAGNIPSGPSLR